MASQRRLVGACCAGLFAPLAFPLLTGRIFTRDDLAAMHLPFRFLYSRALQAGDSFLWMPAMRSGFYLHGEGEGGFAHPLHLLLYRLFPLGAAFNLEVISSYMALLAGTSLLLLRFGLPTEAALFGAMVFAFGGFNLFNLSHVNHIAAIAHAPWLLLGAYVLLTSGDRRSRALAFAGTALAMGSQLLVGNPQYVWLTFVALGFMTLCVLMGRAPLSRVPLMIAALAVGVLIGGIQLLPTLDFIQESTRRAWSLNQSMTFSLSPVNLVQLWSPFALRFRVYAPPDETQLVHEFIVYNGAFCTVALSWLVIRWREQTRKPLSIALLVFAALSLVLAFGRHAWVYEWMARLPGLHNFRAPARHLVLFHLALSGIAAIVFEDVVGLVRRRERVAFARLWPLGVTIILSVAITVLASVLATSEWAASRDLLLSGALRAAPWAAIVVAMALLFVMAARGVQWAVPAVVVLAAFDLGLWGYSYAYRWGPLRSVAELSASAELPPGVNAGELIEPMPGGAQIDLPLLRDVRLVTGYFGLETSSVLDPADSVTARLAGVKWRPIGAIWAQVQDRLPRARLVSKAQVSRDIRADIHAVDITRVGLVDSPIDSLSGTAGDAHVISDRPGAIVVETSSDGRQLLVVSERFHSGWQATEDGGQRHPIAVYGDYLGCVVGAGRHRVEFRFAPASARNGLRASIAGIALTLVATAVLW